MKLFRKNKKTDGLAPEKAAEPEKGMAWLMRDMTSRAENEFLKFVGGHLDRIHEPGGYEREKKDSDFMDLGMGRKYLQALDDIEFERGEMMVLAIIRGGRGGKAQVVTRWTARGIHARPLLGVEPSGEEITIEGVTISYLHEYRLRGDYSYWQIPELTRKYLAA